MVSCLWKDYQRHNTKQPEKCLEFLESIEAAFPDVPREAYRVFVTGSGAGVFPEKQSLSQAEMELLAVEVDLLSHPGAWAPAILRVPLEAATVLETLDGLTEQVVDPCRDRFDENFGPL